VCSISIHIHIFSLFAVEMIFYSTFDFDTLLYTNLGQLVEIAAFYKIDLIDILTCLKIANPWYIKCLFIC